MIAGEMAVTESENEPRPLGKRMIRRPDMLPPVGGQIRHAVFDFDGTLSLLRAGWQQIMIAYFDEVLEAVGGDESCRARRQLCVDFITRLTGRQTIYQCLELADQVGARGGVPLAPDAYKAEFLLRLHEHVDHRRIDVANGQDVSRFLVPGTLELLGRLRELGIVCHLASGTDVDAVRQEAELLGVREFFGDAGSDPRIYGALADFSKFSKRLVIERILADANLVGSALVGFGDGYVEIEETRRAGGWAVAVASDESNVDRDIATTSDGEVTDEADPRMDPWKQERLWQAGAHILTPDWTERDALLEYLGMGSS